MSYKDLKFARLELKIKDHGTARPYASFQGEDAVVRYEASDTYGNNAGEIQFRQCLAYRIGDPNDEGFYSDGIEKFNESIYNCINFPDLKFYDGMFEVSGTSLSQMKELNPGFIDNSAIGRFTPVKARHFVFFLRDATFECFAETFVENGLKPISELKNEHQEYTQ